MKPLAPLHKETKEYIYPVSRREVCIKVEFAFPGNYDIRLVYWKRFRKITKKSKRMLAVAKFGTSKYYTVNKSRPPKLLLLSGRADFFLSAEKL